MPEFRDDLSDDDERLDDDFRSTDVLRLLVELPESVERVERSEERTERVERLSPDDDDRLELVESLSRSYDVPLARLDPVVARLSELRDDDVDIFDPEYLDVVEVMFRRTSFLVTTCRSYSG